MRRRNPIPSRSPAEALPLSPLDAEQFRSVELAAQEVPTFPQGIEVGDPTTPPPAPTGLVVEAGIRSVMAEWDPVPGLQSVEGSGAYEAQLAEDSGFMSGVRAQRSAGTMASWTNLSAGDTYWVRVRAIQGTDNLGEWTLPMSVTAEGVSPVDLPPDSSFIRTVASLPALPDADFPEGSVVFNETDGKLYRNHGDVWKASVAALDIEGQIQSTQIAPGAVGMNQIADFAVVAKKFNTTNHNLY